MPWDGCAFISRLAVEGLSAAGCGGMIACSRPVNEDGVQSLGLDQRHQGLMSIARARSVEGWVVACTAKDCGWHAIFQATAARLPSTSSDDRLW